MTPSLLSVRTAAVAVIGDEILSGRTADKNIPVIAAFLASVDVRLREVRVIPDHFETITQTVRELSRGHDTLITTGGIGPTNDDITVDAVAAAFRTPVVVSPEAEKSLKAFLRTRDLEYTSARARMARIPEGAGLVANPVSGAPGIHIANVFVLAGVPEIMAAMLDNVRHKIQRGRPQHRTTLFVPAGESSVSQTLTRIQHRFPDVAIGSYPGYGNNGYHVNLVFTSDDPQTLSACTADASRALLHEHGLAAEAVDDTDG